MNQQHEDRVRDAVANYVSSNASGRTPDIRAMLQKAKKGRRRQYMAMGAVALAVGATSVATLNLTERHAPRATSHGTASSGGRHADVTRSNGQAHANKQPMITVRGDGARVAPYALPTLLEFAHSNYVTSAVLGTVTDVRTYVIDDGANSVWSVLTIRTEDPLQRKQPLTITARELGGVVTLGDVRDQFEPKLGPIPKDKWGDLVDFNYGQSHAAVGDQVLLFLQKLPDGDSAQFAITARLTREPSDDAYVWEGAAPNSQWVKGVPAEDVVRDYGFVLGR